MSEHKHDTSFVIRSFVIQVKMVKDNLSVAKATVVNV